MVQQPEWKLDVDDKNLVRFRSTEWDQYEATQHPENGSADSNALLLFQFRFSSGTGIPNLWLDLGLSPENDANSRLRQGLFEATLQHPHLFSRPGVTTLPKGLATLHWEADSILNEGDYGVGWDDGATRAKVEAWVAWFAENKFPAMNKVIVECLREYEAEEQS